MSIIKIDSGMFWSFALFENVDIEPEARLFNFCPAGNRGVVSFFTDVDGSFGPFPEQKRPSTMLSNTPNMLHFVDPTKCTEYPENCYSYCHDTCFRTVRYAVDPGITEEYRLQICRRDETEDCTEFIGHERQKDFAAHDGDWAGRHRFFSAHLPKGKYYAIFVDGDKNPVWPAYVHTSYQNDVVCPNAFEDQDVKLHRPSAVSRSCVDLILNGDGESSDTEASYWLYYLRGGVKLELDQGVDGSHCIASEEAHFRAMLIQYLDTRCLYAMEDMTFEFKADIKLLKEDGSFVQCDPDTEECPLIGYNANGSFIAVARTTSAYTSQGFHQLRGDLVVNGALSNAEKPFFFIKMQRSDVRMCVDNVSISMVQRGPNRDRGIF